MELEETDRINTDLRVKLALSGLPEAEHRAKLWPWAGDPERTPLIPWPFPSQGHTARYLKECCEDKGR